MPLRIVCFVACKTDFSNILSAQWLKLKNTHDTWSTSEAFTTSILITQLVAAEESLMAVLGFEQTNPLHYVLQVMHATGLVCSNSAAHNVLLNGHCSSLQQQVIMSIAGTISKAFSGLQGGQCSANLSINIFKALILISCMQS